MQNPLDLKNNDKIEQMAINLLILAITISSWQKKQTQKDRKNKSTFERN